MINAGAPRGKDARKPGKVLSVVQSNSATGVTVAAAPCEGGVLDTESVGRIVARSLGNAVTTVRRQRSKDSRISVGGVSDGGGGSGGGGVSGGGGGRGVRSERGRSSRRSQWKAWKDSPTAALLGKKRPTIINGGANDSHHRHHDHDRESPPRSKTGAASETSPLRGGRHAFTGENGLSYAVSKRNPGGAHAAAIKPPVRDLSATGFSATESSARDLSARSLSAVGDDTSRGTTTPGVDAPPCPPRSRVSLVPRVATLAIDHTGGKKNAGNKKNSHRDGDTLTPPKKTKDFDPDNLECVRRHEASVAERAREAQAMRAEVERRSKFRALPLPSFRSAAEARGGTSVGVGVGVGAGAGTGGISIAAGSRSGGKWHYGSGGLAVGTSDVQQARPGLLSALEQVKCQHVGV